MGLEPVAVERAIRMIMQLATDYYVGCIALSKPSPTLLSGTGHIKTGTVGDPNDLVPSELDQIHSTLSPIARNAGVEIVLKGTFVELYGTAEGVKNAFRQITALEVAKSHIRDTKFQLELALSHFDFINGKKSGKLNRITRDTGCKITIRERYNEHNMLIEVYNSLPMK
ncbi:hypothetical protein HDU93_004371, partial [Gonapodya sp. JEL0774]